MPADHDFLLDPELVFLNHGSYGACPRPEALQRRLFNEHRIEVPVFDWEGHRLLRVSIGPYNDEVDLDALVAALATEGVLPGHESRR